MSGTNFPQGVKLGVDVGMVRVGLASCDPEGILATPVKTLKRDVKKNSDIRVLVKEVAARGAVQVFVGLPKTLKGEEKSSALMARDYAETLAALLAEAELEVAVHLIDERLTTVTAHQALHQAGLDSREHRKVVDQVAAVAILQHAIDMQKARNENVGRVVAAVKPGVVGTNGNVEKQEEHTISTQTQSPQDGSIPS